MTPTRDKRGVYANAHAQLAFLRVEGKERRSIRCSQWEETPAAGKERQQQLLYKCGERGVLGFQYMAPTLATKHNKNTAAFPSIVLV